jgi:putative hemolysin
MFTFLVLRVLGVVLLVATNAFFVAAEFALVSIRDTRVQQLIEARRIGARTIRRLHERMDEVLAAVQLGVTIASLALGWVGEATVAALLFGTFQAMPHAHLWAHGTAIAVAFVLITYMQVTLGEIVPKSIALQRGEQVALAVSGPLEVFMTATRPFLVIMSRTARLVLRAAGMGEIRAAGVHSPEELKLIVTASGRFGLVAPFQEKLILHALELDSITVREIMVPRPNIFSLPADMSLADALTRVVEEQHSRVPVYDPSRGPEHIIGLLYSKDLSRWMRLRLVLGNTAANRLGAMQARQIMRDVLVVPETKALPDLLLEFKLRKRHLAVVVDEFGSTVGVVTVEDVLEQLVGEIEDEFDVVAPPLAPGATTMELDGTTPLRDLETQHQIRLSREEGFETLAGFVLSRLQKMPGVGDSVKFEGRRYTVTAVEGHRVARVKIEAVQPAGAGDRASSS